MDINLLNEPYDSVDHWAMHGVQLDMQEPELIPYPQQEVNVLGATVAMPASGTRLFQTLSNQESLWSKRSRGGGHRLLNAAAARRRTKCFHSAVGAMTWCFLLPSTKLGETNNRPLR